MCFITSAEKFRQTILLFFSLSFTSSLSLLFDFRFFCLIFSFVFQSKSKFWFFKHALYPHESNVKARISFFTQKKLCFWVKHHFSTKLIDNTIEFWGLWKCTFFDTDYRSLVIKHFGLRTRPRTSNNMQLYSIHVLWNNSIDTHYLDIHSTAGRVPFWGIRVEFSIDSQMLMKNATN